MEAPVRAITLELRNDTLATLRTAADGTLASVDVRLGKARQTLSTAEFGKIEHAVLNAVKIYADALLLEDGTFDYLLFIEVPFHEDSESHCYFEQRSSFPHGCDVAIFLFKNGVFVKSAFKINRLEQDEKFESRSSSRREG